MMDEALIKCIEFEYACLFLQSLRMEANTANINEILDRHPLSACVVQTQGWDNIADMVDSLMIYPYRSGRGTQNFYNYLRERLFGYKSFAGTDSGLGTNNG